MGNARLEEAQAGIEIAGRNINNLRYSDDTTLMAESEEELFHQAPLDESERKEWKSWLKTQYSEKSDHGIQFHHFMEIDGETMETLTDFIFWGSKITADGDCSHEVKTLDPWKKSYDKPWQHLKKQGHYFADKGPSS